MGSADRPPIKVYHATKWRSICGIRSRAGSSVGALLIDVYRDCILCASVRRPKQFGAKHQTCPHVDVGGRGPAGVHRLVIDVRGRLTGSLGSGEGVGREVQVEQQQLEVHAGTERIEIGLGFHLGIAVAISDDPL